MSLFWGVIQRARTMSQPQHGQDLKHAIMLDSDSELSPTSPLPFRPNSSARPANKPNKPFRTAEAEREEVNKRIREKGFRPHAGSSSLSTRDSTTDGRTISLAPWSIEMVLIRELFYFDNEMDRTDDIKAIYKRTFVSMYFFYTSYN